MTERLIRVTWEELWGDHDSASFDIAPNGFAIVYGADTLAHEWAVANGIQTCVHPAQWKTHGKRAGPIRNQEMLDYHPEIDLCVALVDKPLAQSRGTADMVRRAIRSQIHHVVAEFET